MGFMKKLQGWLVAQIINMLGKIIYKLPQYNDIIPHLPIFHELIHAGSKTDSISCFSQRALNNFPAESN